MNDLAPLSGLTPAEPIKRGPDAIVIPPKEFLSETTRHKLKFQGRVFTFLFWMYGFVIVATVGIVFLEGFHYKDFRLPENFLMWLGAATLGEMGGLLTLTWGALFRSES
jgi:hypothetical protein